MRARIDRQSVRQYAPLSRRDQLTRPFRNITPGDTGHTLAEQPHRQSRTHAHVHARACIDTGSWSSSPRVHACVCACSCGLVSSLLAASGRMCRATVPDMRTEPVTESAGRITRRSDRLPETPHHAPQGARGRRSESVRARIDRQSVRQYAPLSRRDQLTRPFRNITPGDTGHTLAEQPHRQSRTHAHVHARACIDTGSWSSSPRVHACVCACSCGLVSSLLAASGRMCRATVPDMRTEPVTESAGRITRRSDRLPETPHHAPQGARGRRESVRARI